MKKMIRISVCSQKGGVGKSTFTVLLAGWLHYRLGCRVMVADCDYPQWSIVGQRERELSLLEKSDYYKLQLIRQFKATGQKLWPLVGLKPEIALSDLEAHLAEEQSTPDILLLDLPGTINTPGILNVLATMDYLFIPMKADRIVMESTLTFAKSVDEQLLRNPRSAMRGVALFWTMVDRRERTPLYDQYDKAIEMLGLQRMESRIPYRSRFNKELAPEGGVVFRSTILAATDALAKECSIDTFAEEVLQIIQQ